MTELRLLSPLSGWAAPLEETPDPVFAERMMGDGVAIDPVEGSLHAPCDGEVISVHRGRHAVALKASGGAELLIHLGLETVALGGEGMTVHVSEGQAVSAGDLLISFDLDLLSRRAKSLLTPVLLTGDGYRILERVQDREVRAGELLMRIAPEAAAADVAAADVSTSTASREVVLPLAHGLHARPSARLAQAAGRFTAEVAVAVRDRSAGARSAVGLMALGAGRGDVLVLSARGEDAEAAVETLALLIEGGLGEPVGEEPPAVEEIATLDPLEPCGPGEIRGVRASPGLALGVAFRLRPPEIEPEEAGAGVHEESHALRVAQAQVRARLSDAAKGGGADRQGILTAHLAMLEDPALSAEAEALIAEGRSAGFAWRAVIRRHVEALRALGDGRMAERIGDLIDLERQVLVALTGESHAAPELPERAIVITEELLPSELSQLDPARIAGFVTAAGGPTSHVAIIAVGMGIPALVAAGPSVFELEDGAEVILDADAGLLRTTPAAEDRLAAEAEVQARAARRREARAGAAAEAHMADGTRIEVFANVGSAAEARLAAANGAEGCGLLRTEFLFLDREEAPDEDEQLAAYQEIADALEGRPIVIRTLDIGSDKPAGYLPMPREENPALGLRGVRVSLWRQDLLRTQLRAILRVQPAGLCKVMLPMVADVAELRAVRAILDEERAALGLGPVELGANVETPAAAIASDLIGLEADFLSIGTNDMTQYSLAMDRGHPALAARQDAMHPAVLRLIAATAAGAERRGRWLGVCGGLASDLAAVPVLIGLGVTELSAAAGVVAEVKGLVRTLTMSGCRALAEEVLQLETAADIRRRVAEWTAAQATTLTESAA